MEPRDPTLLFDDHPVVDLGDLRVELFDFRAFHYIRGDLNMRQHNLYILWGLAG